MPKKPIANHDLPPPPAGKYPAKAHAKRVATYIAEHGGPTSGIVYLEGQKTHMTEVLILPGDYWWCLMRMLTIAQGR